MSKTKRQLRAMYKYQKYLPDHDKHQLMVVCYPSHILNNTALKI